MAGQWLGGAACFCSPGAEISDAAAPTLYTGSHVAQAGLAFAAASQAFLVLLWLSPQVLGFPACTVYPAPGRH